MKRRHGIARGVAPVPKQALEDLPTGALLARLKRLRWCEDSRDMSDMSDEDVSSVPDLIFFKEDARWRSAYADLKNVLAEREHVERKP